MKKQFLFLLCTIFLIGMLNAEVKFYQDYLDMGNGTIKNHLTFTYKKEGFLNPNDDYVKATSPLEIYLQYDVYPQTWNNANINNKVDSCTLLIRYINHNEALPVVIINQSYIEDDTDVFAGKYYIKVSDGDSVFADEICYFQNRSYSQLTIPAEIQLITPTWECKSCQYYEWSLLERDIIKADTIGNNVVTVSDYIKKLFLLNFEVLLALFWVFLISMIFVSIGLIFTVAYWFWLYLAKAMR